MRSRSTTLFYAAAGVIAVDQITKALARNMLSEERPVVVIRGIMDLILSYNRGAAFGILPDWAPLFIIVALVAIYAIVRLREATGGTTALSAGLGLVLGGAAGNLIDRLAFPHRGVTDFLSFHIAAGGKTYSWPTFNIADVGIVLGALLLFFSVYIVGRRNQEREGE